MGLLMDLAAGQGIERWVRAVAGVEHKGEEMLVCTVCILFMLVCAYCVLCFVQTFAEAHTKKALRN